MQIPYPRRAETVGRRDVLALLTAVLSSAWCRCIDTADLAFGRHEVWPALNSRFGDRMELPDASRLLREALARLPERQFEVWVTHQVNMTALAGEYPGMGEAFIVDSRGQLLVRTRLK